MVNFMETLKMRILREPFLNEGVDDGGSALHFLNEGVDDGGSTLHFLNEGVDDRGSTLHFLNEGKEHSSPTLSWRKLRVELRSSAPLMKIRKCLYLSMYLFIYVSLYFYI